MDHDLRRPSRQELFDSVSLRKWYALGAIFEPIYRVPGPDGDERLGCQTLAVADVESGCFIGIWLAPRAPAAFTASEIGDFAESVFARHGAPKAGVLVLPSAWMSSGAVHDDPSTRDRVAAARALDLVWHEMCPAQRLELSLRMTARGLSLEWREEDVPGLRFLLEG